MAPKKVSAQPASKKAKVESAAENAEQTEEVAKVQLQKQFNSACRYESAKDSPEQIEAKRAALKKYLEGNALVKSEALAKYASDKSMKWAAGWTKSMAKVHETTTAVQQGWMTQREPQPLQSMLRQARIFFGVLNVLRVK